MIRSRSFRAQRDVVVGAIDALGDIADELGRLDKMVVAEGKEAGAAIKARVIAESKEQRRRLAAEHEASRTRMRRELEAAALRAGF